MKQQYFILVLAHSLHGRLRRVQIPYQAVYLVLALAVVGSFSLFGMVTSYLRMTWKVNNYNSLRQEVDLLRQQYRDLQRENTAKENQLATLQTMASEVSVALGIQRRFQRGRMEEGDSLVPTYQESLEQYNFLRSANFSRIHRQYSRQWHTQPVPSIWPVNGRLLSSYGGRSDPFSGEGAFHAGVDIACDVGTPVRVAADGVVYLAEWMGGYGKLVVVDHGNGVRTYYAHLSRISVIPGQDVRRGDVIALSGATGRVTAPHLHYEVRMGGSPVNPYPYLAKAYVTPKQRDFPF
jgi:murein DD-endopeptidase MepM/ murein hydrolase activator NlpD